MEPDNSRRRTNSRRRRGGAAASSWEKRKRKRTTSQLLPNEEGTKEILETDKNHQHSRSKRYALILGYIGSDFHGMQRQVKDGLEFVRTVEGDLVKALGELQSVVFREGTGPVGWSRAARTDKGVHAATQVVACNVQLKYETDCVGETSLEKNREVARKILKKDRGNKDGSWKNPLFEDCIPNETEDLDQHMVEQLSSQLSREKSFLNELSTILPSSIRLFGMKRVSKAFDARLLCCKRNYEYILPFHALHRVQVPQNRRSDYRYQRLSLSIHDWISQHPAKNKCSFLVPPERGAGSAQQFEDSNGELLTSVTGEALVQNDIGKFEKIMQQFRGCHCFHNFTSEKKSDDPTAKRYIEDISVNKLECAMGDYLVISITGQSFLLHQIRKMIGLAIEIFRGSAPYDAIEESLCPTRRRNVHLAPGEGLVLNRLFYDAYNESGRPTPPLIPYIQFDEYDAEIQDFKKSNIYPAIVKSFTGELWETWLAQLNQYPFILTNYSRYDQSP